MIVTPYVLFPPYQTANIWRMNVLLPEIWDALRAAAEAELILAQAIIDSAGVIVQNDDLTICYDERGA